MRVKFMVEYVGRETAMKIYLKGDEADISPAQALELIGLGVAEAVIEDKPEPIKKQVKHGKNTQ